MVQKTGEILKSVDNHIIQTIDYVTKLCNMSPVRVRILKRNAIVALLSKKRDF